ncbi:MAG: hypothetical protein ABI333_03255 [bacterium]
MRRLIGGSTVLVAVAAVLVVSGCCETTKCPAVSRARPRVAEPPPLRQPEPRPRATVTRPAWPMTCAVGVPLIEKQAAAHVKLSELVSWYGRTRGEKSFKKTLFVGRERLISRRTLAFLKDCLEKETDPVAKLTGEYLRSYLAMAYIERKTAHLDDQLSAAELGASVKLPWLAAPTMYRDLPGMLIKEKNAKRRTAISTAMADIRRRVLNPLLIKKIGRGHELAQWMGFQSYVALSTQVRKVELGPLITQGAMFVRDIEPLFGKLMNEVAKESMKTSLAKLTRADHGRLFSAPKVKASLPQELMIPTLKYFLQGIGLDLSTAANTRIHIDDSLYAQKKFRAACYPITVPSDIRITVKPAGGLLSWTTLFHEGGHAVHFAWTTTNQWAFQQLGSYSLTEAFSELFARSWEDPAWLERYAQFVKDVKRGKHNKGLLKGLGRVRVAGLNKKQMGYMVRSRLAYNMYLQRRYGWAKLIYEVALHGGRETLYKAVYTGQTSDRRRLYQSLFAHAYGYKLNEYDADQYLTDVDPFFYSADYARAFMLADIMHEHLRGKFGRSWYGNKAVGPYLKTLFAEGNRYTAEQIAAKLGSKLDYTASVSRMKRLYDEAEVLSGRKKAAKQNKPGKVRKKKPCKVKPGALKCKIPGR